MTSTTRFRFALGVVLATGLGVALSHLLVSGELRGIGESRERRIAVVQLNALTELSRATRRPLYEIEGLISFYPHFRTDPPSKVDLHVCHDLSCWLRSADDRIAELHRDAERRRLASTPARPLRGTVHRPPSAPRPAFGRTTG